MTVASLLASPGLRIVGIPVAFVLVGAYARRLARRDNDSSPWWESWAVGTSTLLMTIGTIVADLQRKGAKADELVVWLVGVLLIVFASVDHDRFRSWKTEDGVAMRRPIVGVLIPDLLSMATFMAYQAGKV
jgi:hypothetical protein